MKNVLKSASLIALGCVTSLSISNSTHSIQPIAAFSTQSNLKHIEYCAPNIVTSGAVVVSKRNINVLEDKEQKIEINFAKTMYTTTNVNVRENENLKSNIITIIEKGETVKVFKIQNNGWSKVLYKNKIRYIYSKYLSKNKPKKEVEALGDCIEYIAPSGHHPKTYMDWDCITSPSSKQYKMKQQSYIGNYGLVMYQGRYSVALGSGFIKSVGTKFDLILANGTVIPCIAGDMKANIHTDASNKITAHDGSIAEFIVNTSSLTSKARKMGDISYSCSEWNSEIVKIRVY